jgi:YD repeat-containing protein
MMAGRRVQRVDSAGVTKTWSYTGNNIASMNSSEASANVHRVYTVAPGQIGNALDRHDVDPTANGGDGSTTSQYYLYNHRGDVVGVTDASGVLKALHEYNAYGNVTTSYSSGSGAGPDEILFTGKDADLVSGTGY